MIDFGLNPCPLCGGEAEVVRLTQNAEELTAVIKCSDCGLTLEWATEYEVHRSRSSGTEFRRKVSLDPIEAWNRRTGCEDCGANCKECTFKAHSNMVAALNDCNNCGAKEDCEHVPQPGQFTRINCPLWQAEEKEDA